MRIGITGSTGVLGSSLIDQWTDHEFIPFKSDISDLKSVKNWYDESGPFDAVIHLAALVPVDKVKADPLRAFNVNVTGTCNLLEAIRLKANRPWIFYCSSSHVYKNSTESLKESSPIDPVSLYGQTKAQGDKWCEIYRDQYQLDICVGRVFSYSSKKQPQAYFIPSMIKRIKEAPKGATLEVRGLHGTRDFLTPAQISEAIAFLFSKKVVGTFNIGTGESIKLLDLVDVLIKKLGREDIRINALKTDTNHLVADVNKLKEAGLKLHFSLDSFLDSIIP